MERRNDASSQNPFDLDDKEGNNLKLQLQTLSRMMVMGFWV